MALWYSENFQILLTMAFKLRHFNSVLYCMKIWIISECKYGRLQYKDCGFYSRDICVWIGVFGDNVVNCPRDCYDEDSCYRPDGKLFVLFKIRKHFLVLSANLQEWTGSEIELLFFWSFILLRTASV